jgi:hypothetical protein
MICKHAAVPKSDTASQVPHVGSVTLLRTDRGVMTRAYLNSVFGARMPDRKCGGFKSGFEGFIFIKRERAGSWTHARRRETGRERKTTCFETAETKAMFRTD